MSDRVMYLGYEDTVTGDSSIGTGFPFFTKSSIGANDPDYWPLVLAREDANVAAPSCARWALRSRVWNFDGDAGFGTADMADGTGRTSEVDIRRQPGGGTVFQTYSSGGVSVSLEIFGDPLPSLFDDSGSLRPQFHLTGNSGTTEINSVEADLSGPADGSINATAEGLSFTLYYIGTPPTFFDLFPVEFWPYKGTDGNPIYDTATGLELQDPNA